MATSYQLQLRPRSGHQRSWRFDMCWGLLHEHDEKAPIAQFNTLSDLPLRPKNEFEHGPPGIVTKNGNRGHMAGTTRQGVAHERDERPAVSRWHHGIRTYLCARSTSVCLRCGKSSSLQTICCASLIVARQKTIAVAQPLRWLDVHAVMAYQRHA